MNTPNIDISSAVNEIVRDYAPGSPDRTTLQTKLAEMENEFYEIPRHVIGRS